MFDELRHRNVVYISVRWEKETMIHLHLIEFLTYSDHNYIYMRYTDIQSVRKRKHYVYFIMHPS